MKYLILSIILFACKHSLANITMPAFFSSNMVLQQKSTHRFFGDGKPNEAISITCSWENIKNQTKVTNNGNWELEIKTPSYGGPYTIIVEGNNKIILDNILIGEVWLVSGQSNMEWSAEQGINNAENEIKEANFPKIRFFNVGISSSSYPQKNLNGQWTTCTPETMKSFSAIGYFFAQKVHDDLNIPIGIINSSWGGTPAESWTPEENIFTDPVLSKDAKGLKEVPWGPVRSGTIYNAMIAPFKDFKIKGVLWYQGESNVANAKNYDKLLNTLIISWRKQWNSNLPFYFVQIAPYKYGDNYNGVMLRNAQRRAEKIENTAMITISDIGDTTDIHPKNKKEVGIRLANVALKNLYGFNGIKSFEPKLLTYEVKKEKIILYFNSEDIRCNSKCKDQFEISDISGNFIPANVKVTSNTITLSSSKINYPLFARFAWGNTTLSELKNTLGLPVSSFITDNWTDFKNE